MVSCGVGHQDIFHEWLRAGQCRWYSAGGLVGCINRQSHHLTTAVKHAALLQLYAHLGRLTTQRRKRARLISASEDRKRVRTSAGSAETAGAKHDS